MKSKQELWDMIEQRMDWSWDTKIPALLLALSAIPSLPQEMKEQETILNALLIKAEMYGRYRIALDGLTSNEVRIRLESQPAGGTINNLTVNQASAAAEKGASTEKLITEISRLEKEITSSKLDIGAILRFLRK